MVIMRAFINFNRINSLNLSQTNYLILKNKSGKH